MFKKRREHPGRSVHVNRSHFVKLEWASREELTLEGLEDFIQSVRAEGEVISMNVYGSGLDGWIRAYVKAHEEDE